MLKTTGSSGLLALKAFRTYNDEVVRGSNSSRADEMVVNLFKSKKLKNKKFEILTRSGAMGEPMFLTLNAKKAFNHLRQAFIKAPILRHFDLECHIWIKTDVSGYAIGKMLSQLTLDHLTSDQSDISQWHLIAYFSRKMIPAETRYETHDAKLLVIIEAFKTWRHYLEGCKHKVLVLIDHNNLCRFMDTKSLSFKQVRWAQKLSRYYFWIDYYQGKANGSADALSCFL